jgi:hypothetical protein
MHIIENMERTYKLVNSHNDAPDSNGQQPIHITLEFDNRRESPPGARLRPHEIRVFLVLWVHLVAHRVPGGFEFECDSYTAGVANKRTYPHKETFLQRCKTESLDEVRAFVRDIPVTFDVVKKGEPVPCNVLSPPPAICADNFDPEFIWVDDPIDTEAAAWFIDHVRDSDVAL